MIKKISIMSLIFIYIFLSFIPVSSTSTIRRGAVTGSNVNVRRGPGSNHAVITQVSNRVVRMPDHTIHRDQGGCSAGWYRIFFNNNLTDIGFICANFLTTDLSNWVDPWGRAWTTPKLSIMGGSRFIANSYINRGQFTTYLQKFNVNPNSDRAFHTHQYMTNIMAPYTEAQSHFNSYNSSGLINRPLVFSIPIFDNMPNETNLSGYTRSNNGTSNITNQAFENYLVAQGFPETYRRRLRVLNQKYPNWVFEAMHTTLDWNESVSRQRAVGAIQATNSNSINWPHRSGSAPIEGTTWWRPTTAATAYFLDPRNFLDEVRIMQFERLNFSNAFRERDVQVVIQNTFMRGLSELDNQSYASIFMEAGRAANVNPVHLASRARLEVGNNGSPATSGAQFTHRGVTYSGLFNFFNIGAFSSDPESPVRAGLVWASGGLCERCTPPTGSSSTNIGNYRISGNQITGINLNTTVNTIRSNLSGHTVTIRDANGRSISGNTIVGTGAQITISNDESTNTYTVVIRGDITGTGVINSADLAALRQHLLGTRTLTGVSSTAADVNRDGRINSADLAAIRLHLLGQRAITQ